MLFNQIFESLYTKFFIVVMLALMITFVHEVDLFKSVWALVIIGGLTLLFYFNTSYDDLGILLLLIALFIVVYNQQLNAKYSRQL